MSFKLMGAAYATDVGDALAKFVLLVIAEHADTSSHECWPSLTRIQNITHLSRQTVVKKLDYLEQHGFITRDKNKRRSTTYTIVVNVLDHTSLAPRPEPVTNRKPKSYPVPDNWTASEEVRVSIDAVITNANLVGVNHDIEQVKFVSWHKARHTQFSDWDAQYTTWCLNNKPARVFEGGGSSSRKHTGSYRQGSSFFSQAAEHLTRREE